MLIISHFTPNAMLKVRVATILILVSVLVPMLSICTICTRTFICANVPMYNPIPRNEGHHYQKSVGGEGVNNKLAAVADKLSGAGVQMLFSQCCCSGRIDDPSHSVMEVMS